MAARILPSATDPTRPGAANPIRILFDGEPIDGLEGQTIAGVLLGAGISAWRSTSAGSRPRGVFCGIGVCFDCVTVVNGMPDVRACQRRARDGDTVTTQHDPLPGVLE